MFKIHQDLWTESRRYQTSRRQSLQRTSDQPLNGKEDQPQQAHRRARCLKSSCSAEPATQSRSQPEAYPRAAKLCPADNYEGRSRLGEEVMAATQMTFLSLSPTSVGHEVVAGGCNPCD